MKPNVFVCRACHAALFPARYFCPYCGGAHWMEEAVSSGTVLETTVVRHRLGVQDGNDIHLATVKTAPGPMLVVRLDGPTEAGTTVVLEIDDEMRILGRAGDDSGRAP